MAVVIHLNGGLWQSIKKLVTPWVMNALLFMILWISISVQT
jgi:hypothetical protein